MVIGNAVRSLLLFILLLPKFLLHIKPRTSLGREFIMSMNLSLRIFLLQLLYERFQRSLLLGGSGVLQLAILG